MKRGFSSGDRDPGNTGATPPIQHPFEIGQRYQPGHLERQRVDETVGAALVASVTQNNGDLALELAQRPAHHQLFIVFPFAAIQRQG